MKSPIMVLSSSFVVFKNKTISSIFFSRGSAAINPFLSKNAIPFFGLMLNFIAAF